MRRWTSNLVVDVAGFVVGALVVSTGVILKWVLPPGTGRLGWSLLGLERHDWGNVHFVLALVLTGLVGLHVVLHWGWIRGAFGLAVGATRERKRRLSVGALSAVFLLVAAALIVVPLFLPTSKPNADSVPGPARPRRGHPGRGRRGAGARGAWQTTMPRPCGRAAPNGRGSMPLVDADQVAAHVRPGRAAGDPAGVGGEEEDRVHVALPAQAGGPGRGNYSGQPAGQVGCHAQPASGGLGVRAAGARRHAQASLERGTPHDPVQRFLRAARESGHTQGPMHTGSPMQSPTPLT